MSNRQALKELVNSGSAVLKGGAYDGITAAIAAAAGFDVLSVGGFAVAGSLGMPDVGLMTMDEVLSSTRSVIRASRGKPVMADIDTGYGNALNLMRTIREFEAVGVAGVQFEDQMNPKVCPLLGRTPLISVEEAVGKVRAACTARADPNLVLSARTDATTFEEAVARGRAYKAAGADMIYLIPRHFIKTENDLRELRVAIGAPIGFSLLGKEDEILSVEAARRVGNCVVGFPFVALTTMAAALQVNYRHLLETQDAKALPMPRIGLDQFEALIGFPEVLEAQADFLSGFK